MKIGGPSSGTDIIVELGTANLIDHTIQTISVENILQIPLVILLGCKWKRGFDSRHLHSELEKPQSRKRPLTSFLKHSLPKGLNRVYIYNRKVGTGMYFNLNE